MADEEYEAVIAAMMENVANGDMVIVGYATNGEPYFRMTDQGKAKVEAMIHRD